MIIEQGNSAPSKMWPALVSPESPGLPPGLVAASGSDLTLGLQPRHALGGGMLRGAEASLRWGATGPQAAAGGGGEVSARMSFWLLEAACREAQSWHEVAQSEHGGHAALMFQDDTPALMVSVDMPARSLREGRLPEEVRLALEHSGLAPNLLEIALPEYAVTDGSTEVLLGMSALRDLGVGLALDRFGSVSASLRLLQRLPLTAVKLDPGLTRDLVCDRHIRTTLAAAVSLAHALQTNVVATGVDSVDQRDILADMGCDDAQGNLFSAPLAPECFRNALRGVLPEELQ